MSKYTTEVRFICEKEAGYDESKGYANVEEILAKSHSKIFDFHYPIFDENYRSVLEQKILRHYYLREICSETVGVWKLFLDAKMNEIMPYYNKLYESELFEFNPMFDVDLTITHNLTNDKVGSENNQDNMTGTVGDVALHTGTIGDHGTFDHNTNDVHDEAFSDTPQGDSVGITSDSHKYLTTFTRNQLVDKHNGYDDNTRTFNNQDSNTRTYNTISGETRQNLYNTTEHYLETIQGKRGGITYAKMLSEYRDTLINIDMMIINDLRNLFFGLW